MMSASNSTNVSYENAIEVLCGIQKQVSFLIKPTALLQLPVKDSFLYLKFIQDIFQQLNKLELSLNEMTDLQKQEISPIWFSNMEKIGQLHTMYLSQLGNWQKNQLSKIQNLFEKLYKQPANREQTGQRIFYKQIIDLKFDEELSTQKYRSLANFDSQKCRNKSILEEIENKTSHFCQLLEKLLCLLILNQDKIEAENFFLTAFAIEDQQEICRTLFSLFGFTQTKTDKESGSFFDKRFSKDQKWIVLKKSLEEQQFLLQTLCSLPKNRQALLPGPFEKSSSDLNFFDGLPEEILYEIFSNVDSMHTLLKLRLTCSTFCDLAQFYIAKRSSDFFNKKMTFADAFHYKSIFQNYLNDVHIPKIFKPSNLAYSVDNTNLDLIQGSQRVFFVFESFGESKIEIWDLASQKLIKSFENAGIKCQLDSYLLLEERNSFFLVDLNLLETGSDPRVLNFAIPLDYDYDYPQDPYLVAFSNDEILFVVPSDEGKKRFFSIFNKNTKESRQAPWLPLANGECFFDEQILEFRETNQTVSFYKINSQTFELEKLSFLSEIHDYYFLNENTCLFGNQVSGLFELYDFDKGSVIAKLNFKHSDQEREFSFSKLGYFVLTTSKENTKQTLLIGKVKKNKLGQKELLTEQLEIDGEDSVLDSGSFNDLLPWMFCIQRQTESDQYILDLSEFSGSKTSEIKVMKTHQLPNLIIFDPSSNKIVIKDIFSPPLSLPKKKMTQLYERLQTERPQQALDFFIVLTYEEQEQLFHILSDQETFFNGQKATNEHIALMISTFLIDKTQLLNREQDDKWEELANLCIYSIPSGAAKLFAQLPSSEKENIYTKLEELLGVSETGYFGQGEDAWFNQNGQKATNTQRQQALAICFKIDESTKLNPKKRRASTELVR